MIIKINGIKVEITFLFVAFISFIISLDTPSNVFITISSSILHEAGHLFTMISLGNKPEKVKFELAGINIIRNQETSISTKNEILISLGGPLINALMTAVCCIVLAFYNNENVLTFACINLILMTFNLLPVKKLDGGRILYFLLSTKLDFMLCSKILKITSLCFILIIFVWGIYIFVASSYNFSLIIIAVFLFISYFNDNEY